MQKQLALLVLLLFNLIAKSQTISYTLPQPAFNYVETKKLEVTVIIPQYVAIRGGVANCYLYADTNLSPIYYDKSYTFPVNAQEQTYTYTINNVSNGVYYLRYAILAKDSTRYFSAATQITLTPTSIKDEFQSTGVSAFPNPAAEIITIPFLQENKNSRVEIFDATGAKKELIFTDGTANVSILAKGIYFITLQYNGHKKSLKFLKE